MLTHTLISSGLIGIFILFYYFEKHKRTTIDNKS